jgi:hypothetical protein
MELNKEMSAVWRYYTAEKANLCAFVDPVKALKTNQLNTVRAVFEILVS